MSTVSIDPEAGAFYLQFDAGKVDKTIQLSPAVNADIKAGKLGGVEILGLNTGEIKMLQLFLPAHKGNDECLLVRSESWCLEMLLRGGESTRTIGLHDQVFVDTDEDGILGLKLIGMDQTQVDALFASLA